MLWYRAAEGRACPVSSSIPHRLESFQWWRWVVGWKTMPVSEAAAWLAKEANFWLEDIVAKGGLALGSPA